MIAELSLIAYYSLIHVLAPGHSKTLLVAGAVSGKGRSTMFNYALGFAFAHGTAMVGAVGVGFAFKGALMNLAGNHPEIILKVSLCVLALACVYFFVESLRIHARGSSEHVHEPQEGFLDRHPLLTGMFAGGMPCPDVIGIGLVVPNMVAGMSHVLPALLVVWLTVSSAILLMGIALTLLPIKSSVSRFHLPEWFPSGASAAVCMAVILYRVYCHGA